MSDALLCFLTLNEGGKKQNSKSGCSMHNDRNHNQAEVDDGVRNDEQEMIGSSTALADNDAMTTTVDGVQVNADGSVDWNMTLWGLLVIQLASGCGYTLAIAWQDSLLIPTSHQGALRPFTYPLIQTVLLMFGQSLNLAMARWTGESLVSKARESQPSADGGHGDDDDITDTITGAARRKSQWLWCGITATACIEVLQCFMSVASLSRITPSVYSMMRMLQLLFAAGLQTTVIPHYFAPLLRRVPPWAGVEINESFIKSLAASAVQFSRRQLQGLCLVLMGVAIVFDSVRHESFADPSNRAVSPSSSSVVMGCVIVLLAVALLAVEVAAQEHMIRSCSDVIGPVEFVGRQGTVGCVVSLSVLGFSALCGDGMDEMSAFWFQLTQGGAQPALSIVVLIVATTALDASGTFLTKYLTANVRPALQPLRSLLLWTIGVSCGRERFAMERFLGFVTSVVGVIIFKKML